MIDFGRHGQSRAGLAVTGVSAAALVAALAVTGPAGASPPDPAAPGPAPAPESGPAVISRAVGQDPAAVRDYWTPERMRSAEPADLPVVDGAVLRAAAGGQAARLPGARVTVPGTAGQLGTGAPQLRASLVPRPYRALPARTNGKVFFSDGGSRWVCSGTAVNSANKSVVWTAGHCVHDGSGGFHRNWSFVPAYSSGYAPYGQWTAGRLLTTPGWASGENISVDLGAAVVRPRNGVRLVNRVGGQGIGFNQSASGGYSSFGYPAAYPFDGSRQWRCNSSLRGRDRWQGSPMPMAIRCNMTGGSSGGGWLRSLSNGVGHVLSVNSYGYPGRPNVMYGPYQGSSALALWNRARDYRL